MITSALSTVLWFLLEGGVLCFTLHWMIGKSCRVRSVLLPKKLRRYVVNYKGIRRHVNRILQLRRTRHRNPDNADEISRLSEIVKRSEETLTWQELCQAHETARQEWESR